MQRHVIVAAILVALATLAGSADVKACGDKFLRVGRSARFSGYAARRPASILIYASAKAKSEDIRTFQDLLKRAGHTTLAVTNGSSLPEVLAGARYDLVIAAYADAGRIKKQLESVPLRPDVLPFLDQPTKAVAAEAERSYPFLLNTSAMDKFDALAEIDRLMSQRAKAAAIAGW